jgi:hypothetical protein
VCVRGGGADANVVLLGDRVSWWVLDVHVRASVCVSGWSVTGCGVRTSHVAHCKTSSEEAPTSVCACVACRLLLCQRTLLGPSPVTRCSR